MIEFKNTFEYKLIYIFRINDKRHKGLVKVGDTSVDAKDWKDLPPNCFLLNKAAKERIDGYTRTAGISYELLHTEIAVFQNKDNELKAFRDYDVGEVLTASGINKKQFEDIRGKALEWYETDLETAKNAIRAVKENRHSLNSNEITKNRNPVIFRPDQKLAIEQSEKYLQKGDRMLWNAKMRFGKTLCALEVVKRMKFRKTIILTHRPVVNEGWYDDFDKIFYDTDYKFGSKKNGLSFENLVNEAENFVYFASIQDLRGSKKVGGNFDKNNEIFSIDWDFVVIDEAHEGTLTTLGTAVLENIIKRTDGTNSKTLLLSGTPFNIIDEFPEKNQVFTWDYVMEQDAKKTWWDKYGDTRNPYDELPDMTIYTYNLNKIYTNSAYVDLEDKAFNFREFFRVWTGDIEKDLNRIPQGKSVGDFVHEEDIISFLNLLTKKDDDSNYPYSTEEYRKYFRHSLWMLPGVKEAAALSKLLNNHLIFGSSAFKIVNVAGDGDAEEENADALTKVKKAIKEVGPDGYTITLSCGKLTTGVTIKEWTCVLMLAGSYSTSPSSYLQTIFRVQSPGNINGKIKEHCYVFDFAPDRALKVAASASRLSYKAGTTTDEERIILGNFLNFCPVIGIDGSKMSYYDVNSLLQQLKKIEIDKVISSGFEDSKLYNDELLKLDGIELEKFNNLREIIGTTKPTKKQKEVDVNKQGLTKEEYEELKRIEKKKKDFLTPEEKALLEKRKEQQQQKQTAISILRGISIRIPLMIYGADVKDNETITIDNFASKVDDASWAEFMPKGVTKPMFNDFKKYYDKDIFEACGRRIRESVRNADNMPPKERIARLSQIFAQFKNPDKETVLTPWRVVNMHIGDCFGGYNFYNEDYSEEIEEPRFINQGQVTRDIFNNPQVKILEINSKTGLYPLYMVYSIYRNKINSPLATNKDYWRETVENNIFVLCKTEMAKKITQRTLVGFKDYKANIHVEEDIINKLKNKNEQLVSALSNAITWNMNDKKMEGKMKFDAIVGNPPYQDSTSVNNRYGAVYNYFYNVAESLSDRYSLISPARFLFNTGLTPKEWNKKMLSNAHIKVVMFEQDATKIFPRIDIKGGVAILYYDKNENFGAIKEFVPGERLKNIASHFNKDKKNNLSSIIFGGRSDLKFTKKFIECYPQSISDRLKAIRIDHPNVEKLSPNEEFELKSSTFDVLPYAFETKSPAYSDNYYKLLGLSNGDRCYRWILKDYMEPRYPLTNNINYFKVVIPESNGSGVLGETLSSPIILGPQESSTPTFISIGRFVAKIEAEYLLKYIKTKLVRLLLGILKKTQHNAAPIWAYIPLQDFTENSDIDWSKSISEIDQQLYKKYGLSQEEIDFIETNVKPME